MARSADQPLQIAPLETSLVVAELLTDRLEQLAGEVEVAGLDGLLHPEELGPVPLPAGILLARNQPALLDRADHLPFVPLVDLVPELRVDRAQVEAVAADDH